MLSVGKEPTIVLFTTTIIQRFWTLFLFGENGNIEWKKGSPFWQGVELARGCP